MQRVICVWAALKQSVVDKAIDQWRSRLKAYARAKEQHFEQLLMKTLLFAEFQAYESHFSVTVTFSYI